MGGSKIDQMTTKVLLKEKSHAKFTHISISSIDVEGHLQHGHRHLPLGGPHVHHYRQRTLATDGRPHMGS